MKKQEEVIQEIFEMLKGFNFREIRNILATVESKVESKKDTNCLS